MLPLARRPVPSYGVLKSPKSSILKENVCAGVCWSDQECAGMRRGFSVLLPRPRKYAQLLDVKEEAADGVVPWSALE